MKSIPGLLGAAAMVGLLAGCEDTIVLSGQRFDTRTPIDQAQAAVGGGFVPARADQSNESRPVSLGSPVANAAWDHRGGNAARAMPHLALSAQPQPLWTASIGAGDSSRRRIATAPVVSGGMIYAMDARNRLTALSTANGGQAWSIDVTPPGDSRDSGNGGGLAIGQGRLYATTGFGELLAIDPATGAIIWRQRFDGVANGAPAVGDDTVLVAGRDGTAWAVDATTGKLRWQRAGVRQTAGILGGPAPALAGGIVVLPWSSGQVIALQARTGEPLWQGFVAGKRAGRTAALIGEMTGDPVIHGGRVYVGNAMGSTAAFDLKTGQQLWLAREGSMGPVWAVGNAVYLVSDLGDLVRLDAATGEVVWRQPMGHFLAEKPSKQRDTLAHYGPVLVGGRLMVTSSDGSVRFYSPESGAVVGGFQMAAGAAAAPAVANGTLYVVDGKGQVEAFR